MEKRARSPYFRHLLSLIREFQRSVVVLTHHRRISVCSDDDSIYVLFTRH